LLANGKQDALETVRSLATKADFHFVVQDRKQPYGTSTPVWLAKELIEPGERFLFLYGDNIYYNEDGSSAIAAFLDEAEAAQTAGAMMAVEVPHDQVSHYGIVAVQERDGREMYQKIVEKPKPEEAPSNLNNAGCFLVSADIFPFVEKSITDSPQAEKYFIDAINWYAAAGNELAVIRTKGEYIDCGTVPGWLHANNRIVGS
jgi:UTP--glucose-1-phosphate uridylyltransferase